MLCECICLGREKKTPIKKVGVNEVSKGATINFEEKQQVILRLLVYTFIKRGIL